MWERGRGGVDGVREGVVGMGVMLGGGERGVG